MFDMHQSGGVNSKACLVADNWSFPTSLRSKTVPTGTPNVQADITLSSQVFRGLFEAVSMMFYR